MAAKPFESRIQNLVYNVDVGIGLRVIKFGLYILGILLVMLLYTVSQFKGLKDADAMDYAQLGRNLLHRRAFITQCIRPASMWCMIEKSPRHNPMIENHPDILHGPVYPAVLAAAYRITDCSFAVKSGARNYSPERWAVIPVGHLFTLFTGILVFLLGKRLFDRKVAWIGMTIFFLSDMAWADSIAGTGLSLLTFLATGAFFTLLVAVEREREDLPLKKWIVPFVLSVAATILAFLTRYGAGLLAPMLALYVGLSFKRKRWLWAGVFILVFLVGIMPWLLRNKMVSGGLLGLAPYTALNDTRLFEADSFMRTLAPAFNVKSIVDTLQRKWMMNMALFYSRDLRTLGDGFLVCIFITTFFFRFVRRDVHVFRWCAALAIFLVVCVAGFYGEKMLQVLHVFWPLVLLYGLAFFFILLDRLQIKVRLMNMVVIVLFVLLCALPLVFSLLPPRAGTPYPPYFQPFITHVSKMIERDELMCTDMPWATAWYGNRDSLQLPVTLDDFYEINDYNKRVSGVYITTITRNQPYVRSLVKGSYKTWFPILEGRIPADFPLSEGFPIGNMDQIFLTDRPRWAE